MAESKYTQDGLPVVSEENIKSLSEIIYRDLPLNCGIAKKISEENPNLYSLLNRIIKNKLANGTDRAVVIGFLAGVITVYESLRRQSSANKLEREIVGT